MPEFPGIRNSGNCRDWETGTPVDLSRIRNKDEAYWNQYRGTPKAWISMKDGRKIWKNPFGSHTAFRFGDTSCIAFLKENFHRIDPSATGMTFRPVFLEGTAAAQNATDFGQLFLGLGGLVLVAAFMLAGMFLSFFLWRRMQEIALYRALGFDNIRIFRIFLVETLSISVAGNLVGLLLAIAYSWLMISGLNSIWNDAVGTSGLVLSIDGISLALGFAINTIVCLAVFSGILLRTRKRSLPSPYLQPLLKTGKAGPVRKLPGTIILLVLFGSAGFIDLSETLSGRFYPSAAFMISGVLVLAGLVFAVIRVFPGSGFSSDEIPGTIYRHIMRNLRLRKAVSITALLLLAIGTFVVFVTAFNRKFAYDTRSGNHSGTGGFILWMEADLPLYSDLNRPDGRKKLGIEEEQVPGNIRFVSLPQVRGEDASCLNLNQVSKPGLTGIPAGLFDTRQSFSFVTLSKDVDPEHPWKTLKYIHDSGCINGFIDQTALTWNLHKQVGDTLNYLDEKGRIFRVRISGTLDNSVFQGNLLVSDSLLNLFFPSTVRIRELLVDLPEDDQYRVIRVLEERLIDQGVVVIPAREKLSSFNAVENTYLDVFLVLGGFGLIVGTAGFVVVVMRNLRDRRREIALYLLLGIHPEIIYRLLARESQAILLSGVAAGILSAFAGTLPSLVHSGATNLFLAFFIIIIVLINGLFWIRFLTKKAIKAVRREPLTRVI
jgi:putative ABC transport system permease protein